MKNTLFLVITCFISISLGFETLSLSGGIIQGQYVANIFVGTPPQSFSVQIDTGSGKLGINCKGCPDCQNHVNPPFDITKSTTASPLTCVP